MSIETKCPYYSECGYVKIRTTRKDHHYPLFNQEEPCGKTPDKCSRYIYAASGDPVAKEEMNKIMNTPDLLTHLEPVSYEELTASYPSIPNNNGRSERRIVGGCHR